MASTLLAFTACGDGDDDDNNMPGEDTSPDEDSSGMDASVDSPPEPVYGGSIAIQDIKATLSVPGVGNVATQGLSINISFSDGLEDPPTLSTGTDTNYCQTYVYNTGDGDEIPAASKDFGPVTISGATTATPNPCTFNADLGDYICLVGMVNGDGVQTAGTQMNGTTTFIKAGHFNANFDRQYVSIAGATNAAMNGTFPVVNATANSLTVANMVAPGAVADVGAAMTFTVLAGEGPVPLTGGPQDNAIADDAMIMVDVADENFDITTTVEAANDFVLEDPTLPNNFWDGQSQGNTTDISVGCAAGSCNDSGGSFVWVVTVSSTTATPTGLTDMPVDTEDGGRWVSTTCGLGLVAPPKIFEDEHMDLHLGAEGDKTIKRSRVTISRMKIHNLTDALAGKLILVGHGYAGFSPYPAPATKPTKK